MKWREIGVAERQSGGVDCGRSIKLGTFGPRLRKTRLVWLVARAFYYIQCRLSIKLRVPSLDLTLLRRRIAQYVSSYKCPPGLNNSRCLWLKHSAYEPDVAKFGDINRGQSTATFSITLMTLPLLLRVPQPKRQQSCFVNNAELRSDWMTL